MAEFVTLSELYEYLEQQALDYFTHDIVQLFNKLALSLKSAGDERDIEKIQWEMIVFFATPFRGEIRTDFKQVDERQLLYLIERLEATRNPFLKARYSHFLWCSPKKHGYFGRIAIENYLQLVKYYEAKDREQPKGPFGLEVLYCLENAYRLAISGNFVTFYADIKTELKRLICSFNPMSESSPAVRTQLLEIALEDKKIFSKDDLAGFDKIFEEIAYSWVSRNMLAAINVYELAERWEMKIYGRNSGKWRRKIAESYESMMRECLKKGNIAVCLHFCHQAILNYREIKSVDKMHELERIYQQNKGKIKYAEFSTTIDLSGLFNYWKNFAEYLIQHLTSEQIIGFLATDEKYLLPNIQKVSESAKELDKASLAHRLFSITAIDQ